MKYNIEEDRLVSEDNHHSYTIDSLESVGVGCPKPWNLTLNYKNGKRIVLAISGEKSARDLAKEIQARIEACSCTAFDLLHYGHRCSKFNQE